MTDSIYNLDALGGVDMTRAPVTLAVEIRDGHLHDASCRYDLLGDASYGDRIDLTGEQTNLRGWGDALDGPAYHVDTGSTGHDLDIPAASIRRLERESGQTIIIPGAQPTA